MKHIYLRSFITLLFSLLATAAIAETGGGTGQPQQTGEWLPGMINWLATWWPF